MKTATALTLVVTTASLTALGGFMLGRAYQDHWRLVELPKRMYRAQSPASTDPAFQLAYRQLCGLEAIDGMGVGPAGERGRFHQLFEPLYEFGNENDFKIMATFTNPVVRAMGLLCLKYCSPNDAREIGRQCQFDTSKVSLFDGGCNGRVVPYRDIAIMEILGNSDFIYTLELARTIDKRKSKRT